MTFKLTSKDLEYVGVDLRPVLEAGEFLFGVGPAADCRANPDGCAALTVTDSDKYHPACKVKQTSVLVGGWFRTRCVVCLFVGPAGRLAEGVIWCMYVGDAADEE